LEYLLERCVAWIPMDGAVGATRHKRIGIESIKISAARGALGLAGPVAHQLRMQFPEFFDHDMLGFEGRCGSAAARISLRGLAAWYQKLPIQHATDGFDDRLLCLVQAA
jgi:hypothetical protein